MDAFLERLINEEKELGEKIVGLNKGLHSDGFAQKVGDYQFELLNLQRSDYCRSGGLNSTNFQLKNKCI